MALRERRLESCGLLALIAAALVGACSAAAGTDVKAVVSPNWAGYVATPLAGEAAAFTTVTGTWTQPKPACSRRTAGAAAAIWVGLGGYDPATQELQQIGSAVGCDGRGKPTSSSWFDLFPYPAHTIPERVQPGDTLTATVTVLATAVQLQLTDRTRGWAFARTIDFWPADTSSAEWIVEAPLACRLSTCRQAPLANFGALTFSKATAGMDTQTGDGLDGSAWTLTPIQLIPGPPSQTPASKGGAAPGPIEDGGATFVVIWHSGTSSSPP